MARTPYNRGMPLEHQQVPRRTNQTTDKAQTDLALNHDELAQLLKEASKLQGEERQKGHQINSLDDALATARELGIEERHVIEAAGRLQSHRQNLARIHARTKRRRSQCLNFLGIMLAVSGGIAVMSSPGSGLKVFAAMCIPLFILSINWFKAWINEKRPDFIELEPARGECRVCGEPAFHPRGHYCAEHRPKST